MTDDANRILQAAQTKDTLALTLVEEEADSSIRRQLHDGRMFFSVVDVIAVLTDSPDPANYWRVLKNRLKRDEGAAQTITNCNALPFLAADGRQRKTDAADVETLLRIIQSVPSPKAEPVKQWLARVGAERLAPMVEPLPSHEATGTTDIIAAPDATAAPAE